MRLEHGDHFGVRRVVGCAEGDVVDATATLADIGAGAHVHDRAQLAAGPVALKAVRHLVGARARAHHKFLIVPHRTPTGAGTSLCGGAAKGDNSS